ncbi:uncharacterized protein [Leptinotarsa decemlineata]|uniref:uncharacterized protein n=1 Tax=Leptinotarsa decemlineata TaxID=7539 RepID=UPI003D30AB31
MADRNLPHISKRTKFIVSLALARANQEEETDSDDSYIPESRTIFPPVLEEEADHEVLSEDGDVLPEDDDALLDDGQFPLLVANLMPKQSPLPSHSRDVDEFHESDEGSFLVGEVAGVKLLKVMRNLHQMKIVKMHLLHTSVKKNVSPGHRFPSDQMPKQPRIIL